MVGARHRAHSSNRTIANELGKHKGRESQGRRLRRGQLGPEGRGAED